MRELAVKNLRPSALGWQGPRGRGCNAHLSSCASCGTEPLPRRSSPCRVVPSWLPSGRGPPWGPLLSTRSPTSTCTHVRCSPRPRRARPSTPTSPARLPNRTRSSVARASTRHLGSRTSTSPFPLPPRRSARCLSFSRERRRARARWRQARTVVSASSLKKSGALDPPNLLVSVPGAYVVDVSTETCAQAVPLA